MGQWRDMGTGPGLPVRRQQGGLLSGFAYRARRLGCQGECFLCLGKVCLSGLLCSLWPSQPCGKPCLRAGTHRPGFCCGQQEILGRKRLVGSQWVCECACTWVD